MRLPFQLLVFAAFSSVALADELDRDILIGTSCEEIIPIEKARSSTLSYLNSDSGEVSFFGTSFGQDAYIFYRCVPPNWMQAVRFMAEDESETLKVFIQLKSEFESRFGLSDFDPKRLSLLENIRNWWDGTSDLYDENWLMWRSLGYSLSVSRKAFGDFKNPYVTYMRSESTDTCAVDLGNEVLIVQCPKQENEPDA